MRLQNWQYQINMLSIFSPHKSSLARGEYSRYLHLCNSNIQSCARLSKSGFLKVDKCEVCKCGKMNYIPECIPHLATEVIPSEVWNWSRGSLDDREAAGKWRAEPCQRTRPPIFNFLTNWWISKFWVRWRFSQCALHKVSLDCFSTTHIL